MSTTHGEAQSPSATLVRRRALSPLRSRDFFFSASCQPPGSHAISVDKIRSTQIAMAVIKTLGSRTKNVRSLSKPPQSGNLCRISLNHRGGPDRVLTFQGTYPIWGRCLADRSRFRGTENLDFQFFARQESAPNQPSPIIYAADAGSRSAAPAPEPSIRNRAGASANGSRTNLREEWKNTNHGRIPQKSNFYCHLGEAGGSPNPLDYESITSEAMTAPMNAK